MSEREVDIAVAGAGAAGLAAAIFAARTRNGARVVALDGARRVGAKILVAGGGRCNVTHWRVDVGDYNAGLASRTDPLQTRHPHRNLVRQILAAFPVERTVEWMREMGVELKREETGKLFPTTDKARTVLDALLAELRDAGATLLSDHRITSIERDAPTDGFVLETSHGRFRARRVILCTGGRSLPKSGSDGGGYALAGAMGHTVSPTHPALVSLVLQQHFFHAAVSGVSHHAELTTIVEGRPVDRRAGSLLWAHFGITGPVAMDASRHWLAAKLAGRQVQTHANLLPGERFETVEAAWQEQAAASPRAAVRTVLAEVCRRSAIEHQTPAIASSDIEEVCVIEPASRGGGEALPGLPEKLRSRLLEWLGIDPQQPAAQLRRDDRRRLIHALVALPLPVEQDRGWNHAEVTAGGVPLSEVNWRTMESRITPGLHLAGEILDVDGRIGGFNFQWAWATGHLAGTAAAGAL